MRAFLNDHQNAISTIGASASVAGTAAGFFASAIPILQFFSLVVGIAAGVLTIIHFFRGRHRPAFDSSRIDK